MSKSAPNIIPQKVNRRDVFNDLLRRWTDYYQKDTSVLINHLYSKGYTRKDISLLLGKSWQTINDLMERKGNL